WREFPQTLGRNWDSICGRRLDRSLRALWANDRDGVAHGLGCRVVVHANAAAGCRLDWAEPSGWAEAWSRRRLRIFGRRADVSIRGFRLGVGGSARLVPRRARRPADVVPANSRLANGVRGLAAAANA